MNHRGLVLEQYDDSAKEWDALGYHSKTHSSISYEPLINSSTIQEESTGAGVQREVYTASNSPYTGGYPQGDGRDERTGEGAAELEREAEQVKLPA